MIRWMSIPSREATQPPGRCKPKTGASSSRKEFAPFRANSSLQSSTPLEIVTLLRKTTGSHTSIFLLPEEAQPSRSLRPLQSRTKSNMSPRGENRGPTDHEPTAPRKSCKNPANWWSAFYLYDYQRRVSRRSLDNVDPTVRNAINV